MDQTYFCGNFPITERDEEVNYILIDYQHSNMWLRAEGKDYTAPRCFPEEMLEPLLEIFKQAGFDLQSLGQGEIRLMRKRFSRPTQDALDRLLYDIKHKTPL